MQRARPAVECSSASRGLHAATQAFREQLLEDHEAATALSIKLGVPSCKTLREIPVLRPNYKSLSDDDLALLGTLVSVLPSLEILFLTESSTGPNGVQRLAAGLGAGALPAMTYLGLSTWATQVPRHSPPPWTEAPCHSSRSSHCQTVASATRG